MALTGSGTRPVSVAEGQTALKRVGPCVRYKERTRPTRPCLPEESGTFVSYRATISRVGKAAEPGNIQTMYPGVETSPARDTVYATDGVKFPTGFGWGGEALMYARARRVKWMAEMRLVAMALSMPVASCVSPGVQHPCLKSLSERRVVFTVFTSSSVILDGEGNQVGWSVTPAQVTAASTRPYFLKASSKSAS